MIGLILLQHGKGADMGAAFGSGASGSLFGATGSANFLSRTTAVLAGVFFVCTLALAYFSNTAPGRRRRQRAGAHRAGAAPRPRPLPRRPARSRRRAACPPAARAGGRRAGGAACRCRRSATAFQQHADTAALQGALFRSKLTVVRSAMHPR